jgi:hypothetical protein
VAKASLEAATPLRAKDFLNHQGVAAKKSLRKDLGSWKAILMQAIVFSVQSGVAP